MKNGKRKRIILIAAAVLLTALIAWIVWGNKALMVTEYSVSSSRVPRSFSGFRIAQVSDLHNEEFGEENEKLLSMLRQAEPNIIVITGDLVDSRNTEIEVGISFGEKAAQIAPTYYVTGNHEARLPEYTQLKAGLEDAGVIVLENESIELERDGEKIALVGVCDPSFYTDYLDGDEAGVTSEALTALMPGDVYTILLSHRPELFHTYVEHGADLVFSGHAHGGQARLPFVGGLVAPNQGLFPEYDGGVYTDGTTTMVVSRGIGNSLFPFRVNNRPEIVIVKLLKEAQR